MKAKGNKYLSWVEVNSRAILSNLKEIKRLSLHNIFSLPTRLNANKINYKRIQILTVIKADAYGHGMVPTAYLLDKFGVEQFAVSDVAEGIKLRKAGIKRPILLLESTLSEYAKAIVDYKLMPTICTFELARALNLYALKKKKIIDVHIEIDTGMGRLGVSDEEAFDFIKKLYHLRNIRVMGIFTHFPSADTDSRFTKAQVKKLYNLVVSLDKKGMVIPFIHAANSMGLCGYRTQVLNLVRPGLMIYGLYPGVNLAGKVHLQPALSVYSRIILIKKVKKGAGISYGRTFIAKKDMTIAVLPLGYNDGYLRAFSNKSYVLVKGQKCPVLGRVTMDQVIIDISKIKDARLGMPVVILGRQGKNQVTADCLATIANTINYEIVCSLGNRMPRIYR